MATRLVFLGSKPIGFRCFRFLLENRKIFDIEITGLRTQARREFAGGHDLAALAAEHNIPILDSLDELPECDIIYSVQHHELLKARHIGKARSIAVNLHMAPLPEYRGCNQFSFAIMDGAEEFGVTLHSIDTRIDHGDVLFERRFPVKKGIWVKELYDRTEEEAFILFRESLPDLLSGQYKAVSQQELMAKRSNSLHFRDEIRQLKRLDLDQSAEYISRAVRATYMPGFEPPYFMIGDKKIYVHPDQVTESD